MNIRKTNHRMRRPTADIALGLTWLVAACLLGGQAQVTGLTARHAAGQTFLTWREVHDAGVSADMDAKVVRTGIRRQLSKANIQYLIYRSNKPITTLEGLEPVGLADGLSGWNTDYHGIYPKPGQKVMRRSINGRCDPLPIGTGLYVHNPKGPEKAGHAGRDGMRGYYAVTYSAGGTENKALHPGNCLAEPVHETQGQGAPVLQRIVKPDRHFNYASAAALHYYVRWEAPPNAAVENFPIDYVVAVPPDPPSPAPVGLHLHCWGGSLNGGYGWWYSYFKRGTTYLIASNQIPYDWWTGYHQHLYGQDGKRKTLTKALAGQGVVKPYSTTRMLSFLDWAAAKYNLDRKRVFTAGNSMGGSGAPMFAIRHPKKIAWSIGWVGVHDPGNTPQFKGSYENVYGKAEWRPRFADGTPVFDHYHDAWYLKRNPRSEIGFISWSNGKNDGGIGWPQAVAFLKAMQATRRPHLFVWAMRGHGTRAVMPMDSPTPVMPMDLRTDQSLPAFTHCSLDDDPGTGKKLNRPQPFRNAEGRQLEDLFDGDPEGQVNRYLYWRTEDLVDKSRRWEITVGLWKNAPRPSCTVDLTPRRLQAFKVKPGDVVLWKNTEGEKVIQSDKVQADEHGLVTLEGLKVSKQNNRIHLLLQER